MLRAKSVTWVHSIEPHFVNASNINVNVVFPNSVESKGIMKGQVKNKPRL